MCGIEVKEIGINSRWLPSQAWTQGTGPARNPSLTETKPLHYNQSEPRLYTVPADVALIASPAPLPVHPVDIGPPVKEETLPDGAECHTPDH